MDLGALRRKIDSIDEQLVRLINERAKVSLEVGQAKHRTGRSIYAPDRERLLLERIKAMNAGPMNGEGLESIWREIMSSSLALEKPLRIAYLGTRGSNSYSAAVAKFGHQLEYCGCPSIPDVFSQVEKGECDYGMVPVENSVEGAVTPTVDMLADSSLQVCAQTLRPIRHVLASRSAWRSIRRIYSNPQVLSQCREWLGKNFSAAGVRQISTASTTDAAETASRQKGSAAVISPECAEIYGLPVLKKDIQDIAHNTTRFFVIARQDAPPTGKDRTSLVFSIKDHVGALHAMLEPFARNGINMTKIESRPIKKKAWDYYFFLDIEGHRSDVRVAKALARLESMCKFMKVLGSYPA